MASSAVRLARASQGVATTSWAAVTAPAAAVSAAGALRGHGGAPLPLRAPPQPVRWASLATPPPRAGLHVASSSPTGGWPPRGLGDAGIGGGGGGRGSGGDAPRRDGWAACRLSTAAAAAAAAAAGAAASTAGGAVVMADAATTATGAAEGAAAGSAPPMPSVTLYQYVPCPYCNKVRAYLDYHNIPYTAVEVDPLRKKALAAFPPTYRKVPIAVIDGRQVNGSGDIIAALDAVVHPAPAATAGDGAAATPAAPASGGMSHSEEELRWLTWVDEKLVKLLPPNIYRSMPESLQTFDYVSECMDFTAVQKVAIRYVGAAAMYGVAKKLKKKYAIEEPRAALYDAIGQWLAEVDAHGGDYYSGTDEPGLVDLAVWGVLHSLEPFDTWGDVTAHTAVEGWYERVKGKVGQPVLVPAGAASAKQADAAASLG